MSLDFDKALGILRNHNEFVSDYERQQRDVLLAAIDNMVDFAVAEEYNMLLDISEEIKADNPVNLGAICERFNLINAKQENMDVAYAAGIASWWITIPEETYLTFMTQGDERVRAWHLSHEGESYAKRNFPPELIPPIEWGCRCFLTTNSYSSVQGSIVQGSIKTKKHIEGVNPIFSESLATGGRIFTDHHPYFRMSLPHEVMEIKHSIKQKFNL